MARSLPCFVRRAGSGARALVEDMTRLLRSGVFLLCVWLVDRAWQLEEEKPA